jgi:hypothetical protein
MLGYEWSVDKKNYQQAVGPASDRIRHRIQEQGYVDRAAYESWIRFISQCAFDADDRSILRKLRSEESLIIDVMTTPKFEHKLRHLADSGLAKRKQNIRPLFAKDAKKGRIDANDILEITELGKNFIALYDASKLAPVLNYK